MDDLGVPPFKETPISLPSLPKIVPAMLPFAAEVQTKTPKKREKMFQQESRAQAAPGKLQLYVQHMHIVSSHARYCYMLSSKETTKTIKESTV